MTNEQLEKAVRELQDTMLVQANLEARLSRGLRDAAEWLDLHEARIAEQEARIAEQEASKRAHEARMAHIELTLAEAGDKLNALIAFVARQHNLPEA